MKGWGVWMKGHIGVYDGNDGYYAMDNSDRNMVHNNLNQNGHFSEAQYYYQQCDSFLKTNKTIPNWVEKKKNVLSRINGTSNGF